MPIISTPASVSKSTSKLGNKPSGNIGQRLPLARKGQKGDKARLPRPGIPIPKEDILLLIAQEHGNLSEIADILGTTRKCIRSRCQNDVELSDALEDARERKLDRLEKAVWTRAEESNDTGLQCFILKTQGRHRGYDQDDMRHATKDIATAAFEFVLNRSKNPAEPLQDADSLMTIDAQANQ